MANQLRKTGENTSDTGHSALPEDLTGCSHEWLNGPLGQQLLQLEEQLAGAALQNIFGFQLVQIGAWGKPQTFVQHSKTLRASLVDGQDAEGVSVLALPEELPLASDSVDVILLPHTLEQCEHPHQALREAHRVLVGEGHVVLFGFSPLSLWGLRQKSLPRFRLAGNQAMLTEHRLSDWLRLLGLELISVKRYFYPLPVNSEKVLEKTGGLERAGKRWWPFFNGAYMIVARKSLLRAATVGPSWHRRRSVVGGLAETATRTVEPLQKSRLTKTSE